MKVYGWTGFVTGTSTRQARIIVAAPSFAQACRDAEAAGLDKPRRDYCSDTENDQEIAAALPRPGVVLAGNSWGPKGEYRPVVGGRLA